MLNTILRNIISNSIKFTPENGTITIIVHSSENSDEIIVSDTGTGMSQETIDKLFKIDSNYTTEGTSGEKGTGLGLILCKEFVDKHNGKLWVESEVGKGTSIHISLPKKKS
jgi:signal transduction histidine kinase